MEDSVDDLIEAGSGSAEADLDTASFTFSAHDGDCYGDIGGVGNGGLVTLRCLPRRTRLFGGC